VCRWRTRERQSTSDWIDTHWNRHAARQRKAVTLKSMGNGFDFPRSHDNRHIRLPASDTQNLWEELTDMPMDGITTCTVTNCNNRCANHANLCQEHKVPGAAFRIGNSTMIITTWYAERHEERGVAETMYGQASDWVFASNRLRGKKPRVANMVVEHYLRPAAVHAKVLEEGERRRFGFSDAASFARDLSHHVCEGRPGHGTRSASTCGRPHYTSTVRTCR
jgi:hypothetical protein